MAISNDTLKKQWEDLTRKFPKIRPRSAAEKLGVSEAELLMSKKDEGVTLLKPDFMEIIGEIENLGKINALTRNNECIIESRSTYKSPNFKKDAAGIMNNDDLLLLFFIENWKYIFAVDDEEGKSIQIFDRQGFAVHKIYLTGESETEVFENLIEKHKTEEENPVLEIESATEIPTILPDDEIDVEGFRNAWKNLEDVHDFAGVLKNYHLSRTQALRLAPNEDFAKKINRKKIVKLLQEAADCDFSLVIFVENQGTVQANTTEIRNVIWHGTWINVMDSDFNLHIDTDAIDELWIVRKPTDTGIITSVEAYNKDGETIIQFFGKREPGTPELNEWRTLVDSLLREISN